MKVVAIKKFRDKYTKAEYYRGATLEMSEERIAEANSTGKGPFVEPYEEEVTTPQTPDITEPDAAQTPDITKPTADAEAAMPVASEGAAQGKAPSTKKQK